jgi:hypothetical protein
MRGVNMATRDLTRTQSARYDTDRAPTRRSAPDDLQELLHTLVVLTDITGSIDLYLQDLK